MILTPVVCVIAGIGISGGVDFIKALTKKVFKCSIFIKME